MFNATSRPFPADGGFLETPAGGYRTRLVPTIEGGVTFQVLAGTHEQYAEGFADPEEGREVARRWTLSLRRRARGEGGPSLDQMIQDRRTYLSFPNDVERFLKAQADAADAAIQAEAAMVDVERVASDLRADIDWNYTRTVAQHNAVVATVQAGRNPNGWNETRKAARATLDAVQDASRPVRATRTRVFTQPLNATQKRALRLNVGGVIYCGRGTGVSPQTVRSMHDRIGGQLLPNGISRHGIAGLRLPADVLAEINGQVAA